MNGIFDSLHRIVTIEGTAGSVTGRITDNVHDFGVDVRHDGHSVTGIAGMAYRVPWTSCPGATAQLSALVGTPLRREDGPGPAVDKAQQCTHLFDLAKLAIGFAPRQGKRIYDIRVDALEEDGACAVLDIDGLPTLRWEVGADRVVRSGPFAGHLTTGAARWPDGAPGEANQIEAAMLLRRALLVFYGRRRTDEIREAARLPHMAGACFSFQPERVSKAVRPDDFVELPSTSVPLLADTPPPSPL